MKTRIIALFCVLFMGLSANIHAQGAGMGGAGMGGGVDFAAVAESLGVTEEAFMAAMGDTRPPDFAAMAEELGIPEEDIMAAMPGRGAGGGGMGGGQ